MTALAGNNGALMAGGSFRTAGGQVSPYLARWACPCYPDCNGDNQLTIADFACFQTKFVAGCP